MIIIDANLMLALVSGDPRGELVLRQFTQWLEQQVELHAPFLGQYEVANGLARLVAAGKMAADKVAEACHQIDLLPIRYHSLANSRRAIEIALSLQRQNAYDAAYLALAETLGGQVWTLDGPLYRNASPQGLPVTLLT